MNQPISSAKRTDRRMFYVRMAVLGVLVGAGCAVAAGACGSKDEPTSPTGATPTGTQPTTSPTEPPEAATPTPPKVQRAQFGKRVRGLFADWLKREADFVKQHDEVFKTSLASLRWFKKLTTRAYEERAYKPLFSDGIQLTESADTLLEALYAVADHALGEAPYDLDGLRARVKAFSDQNVAYEAALTMEGDEKAEWDFLMKLRPRMPLDDTALEAAIASAGYTDADIGRLDRISQRLDALFKTKASLNSALGGLDIALTQRLFRLIFDLRYARRAHPFFADINDGAGVERTADALWEHFKTVDTAAIGPHLKALEPAIPDYRQTMAALKQYRALAEAAGDPLELDRKVERQRMKSKGPLVEAIQKRLKQEDLYAGEVDGKYGPALVKAVKHYQHLHALKETGRVNRKTRISMNVPLSERVTQIELSLQRHRESELHQGEWRFGETPYRGRVNIAEFKARFYKGTELARTHRVIVGNNEIEVDEQTGKKGRFNQTRMFSKEMSTVVLNPTWRVPRRIKEQELDLKLMDEPDFYEKHNYEVKILDDGTEMVMQKPGPNNALGLVKFLFPNRFAIYMHDTPKRRLFNKEYRAFSHGCMRTENPLDLAKWILTEVNDLPDDRFDKILASRKEYGIALKTKIPITVDYNSVGVHESGRPMFFTDVYRYDRDFLAGRTPYRADQGFYMTVMVK